MIATMGFAGNRITPKDMWRPALGVIFSCMVVAVTVEARQNESDAPCLEIIQNVSSSTHFQLSQGPPSAHGFAEELFPVWRVVLHRAIWTGVRRSIRMFCAKLRALGRGK